MTLFAARPLAAQTQMLFGDLQIFGQDFLAAPDPVTASSIGMGAGSQLLTGQAQLDLNERLSFDSGQLYVADSVYWWQGSDGGTLQNDLLQAYVAVTPLPALTLVLGKQRISWGTGYAFFPGDRINPPVNPQNRSEGFYGFSASLAPSASLSVTASVRMDTAFTGHCRAPGPALLHGNEPCAIASVSCSLPSLRGKSLAGAAVRPVRRSFPRGPRPARRRDMAVAKSASAHCRLFRGRPGVHP